MALPEGNPPIQSLDSELFRNAIGHFASGVAVITTTVDGVHYGMAASSLTSVSLDPPTLLVCLNQNSTTHRAVAESGIFGVNILAAEQGHLAKHFARSQEAGDKFDGVGFTLGPLGTPLVDEAHAWFECRVDHHLPVATHGVFFGQVAGAGTLPGAPLAYYRGAFGNLDIAQVAG